MHKILKNPDKWKEVKEAISIGETILKLAQANKAGIPISVLKMRLHPRISWADMEKKIPEIAVEINAIIVRDSKTKPGRTGKLFIVPDDWRDGNGPNSK